MFRIDTKRYLAQLARADEEMRKIEERLRSQGFEPIPGSPDEWIKTEEKGKWHMDLCRPKSCSR